MGVSNMSIQVQEAMGSFSLNACRNPANVTDDWENDCEDQAVPAYAMEETAPTRAALPTPLISGPAADMPPPLSALPATACGLTRPQGFPGFETRKQATGAF